MAVHVFGIRHHGPGSARSLKKALEELQPDCILIEGPPEGDAIVNLVAESEMQPPVALLVYSPDLPARAVYYPFALFSPEWQALQFAVQSRVAVRFMDLPQTNWLAMDARSNIRANGDKTDAPTIPAGDDQDDETDEISESEADQHGPEASAEDDAEDGAETSLKVREDPLSWLARAAGYSDGERWWEHMVEQRRDTADLFQAILEAMTILRQELPEDPDKMDVYREAHMRNMIRTAQKEGRRKIAVVCGAWHAPALVQMPAAKEDAATLKGLPKTKVESTWIPWTHSRLSFANGYGAGVVAPGWYHHLWTHTNLIVERWMALVARLLRDEDLDASSAHIIEAVRLAEALAALRERPVPGLQEVMEAIKSVLCFGNDIPLKIIHDKLIVGEMLGTVPDSTPSVPLQADLHREQKRLRMPADAGEKIYDLDLRKPNDLDRSRLLHRLNLLGITWGVHQESRSTTSTFHEVWQVRWLPDFSLRLIEAGKWGRTVETAASAIVMDEATESTELPVLTRLLDRTLLADLPDALSFIMTSLQNVAAVSGDIVHLMDAIPDLVRVARYGNVRKLDAQAVEHVIDGILSRVCISLPGACSSINDDAAEPMYRRLNSVHSSVYLLQHEQHTRDWLAALVRIADGHGVHGLLAGRACRLLLEQRAIDEIEAARRFGLALSIASGPTEAAAWVEGFLKGSGLLLIHDQTLWNVVDDWLCHLSADAFAEILPLLRRTFSTFQTAERRQMGEKVSAGGGKKHTPAVVSDELDLARADLVLPVVTQLLGLDQ